ncbi:hypothetical protein KPL37_02500 [Clostridium frigoris]|uniref:Uncharacterized protein n=1 Tax=Clostridium frigoris TaxID=205327 RepID=A0ABS6BP03_9CLOT|nr:hypothetical protein [Clostridium frigoris]MBU3158644.1 hypothetical protein [Clostridium frigoris]
MDINQISQLSQIMGISGTQSSTGVSGSDTNTCFETLLKQIVDNSQKQTSTNIGTSVPSIDDKTSRLDSLSLQSQKAQQLQQMMQIMTTQNADSSSSTGTKRINDSSESLFPSTNNKKDLSQLIQTIMQQQNNTGSSNNNANLINTVLSNSIL